MAHPKMLIVGTCPAPRDATRLVRGLGRSLRTARQPITLNEFAGQANLQSDPVSAFFSSDPDTGRISVTPSCSAGHLACRRRWHLATWTHAPNPQQGIQANASGHGDVSSTHQDRCLIGPKCPRLGRSNARISEFRCGPLARARAPRLTPFLSQPRSKARPATPAPQRSDAEAAIR